MVLDSLDAGAIDLHRPLIPGQARNRNRNRNRNRAVESRGAARGYPARLVSSAMLVV